MSSENGESQAPLTEGAIDVASAALGAHDGESPERAAAAAFLTGDQVTGSDLTAGMQTARDVTASMDLPPVESDDSNG